MKKRVEFFIFYVCHLGINTYYIIIFKKMQFIMRISKINFGVCFLFFYLK